VVLVTAMAGSEDDRNLPMTGRCSWWLGVDGVDTFQEWASRRTAPRGGAPHSAEPRACEVSGSGWLDSERRPAAQSREHVNEMGNRAGKKYLALVVDCWKA
jgi:hypothetical protein